MTQPFEDAVSAPAQETTPLNPAIAEQTRLERVIATAIAEKATLREEGAQVRIKANELKEELARVEGAINAAEQKSRLVSAPRSGYVNARADQLARGLMGEPVDLSTVERSIDFAQNLNVEDLGDGIRALKRKRDDLVGRFSMIKGQARVLSSKYYKQHALEHGAQFEILKQKIADHFVQVHAANRLNMAIDTFHPIIVENMLEMILPNIAQSDEMIPLRRNGVTYINDDILGNALARSPRVEAASRSLSNELDGR